LKDIKETKNTIYLSTSIEGNCKICGFQFSEYDGFSGQINHFLEKHNYKLLHVGQETSRDDKGSPWQSTVAIVGR